MTFPEADQPPKKKRRFFVEDSLDEEQTSPSNDSLNNDRDALSTANTTPDEIYSKDVQSAPYQTSSSTNGDVEISTQNTVFDKQTFESFIGNHVASATFHRLRKISGDNIERAINMYLDGSKADGDPFPRPVSSSITGPLISGSALSKGNATDSKSKEDDIQASIRRPKALELEEMPNSRYIGAFGVGAWATRSGTGLISSGEAVKIERTKIKPPMKATRGIHSINLFLLRLETAGCC